MTATILTGPSCLSTKKAKQWFEKNKIPFEERNIVKEPITLSELLAILRMTENGTDEILSTRSKVYKDLQVNLDELPLTELLELFQENPGLLKTPIIMDEKRLQVGYHEDEIRQFIPRKARKKQWLNWRLNNFGLVEG
ncbi:transcriptional regulator Spx [Niallia sp. Krafla_26]|uniref:transcriptional regulator Spx n=1 Tax=Niallia sp. Krafla_26 TaxID=3064703 RepID=UPI003D17019D